MDIKTIGKDQMFLGFPIQVFMDRIPHMEIIAYTALLIALISLFWMGWIDLKLWILPNELIALFAATAIIFHFSIGWYYGGWLFFAIGSAIGGGALIGIRAVANRIYGMDTMGMGDIKLMFAAGLWLGPEGVLMALSVGALCGILHAMFIAGHKYFTTGHKVSLNRMALPAGPGFIAGIILVCLWQYGDFIL